MDAHSESRCRNVEALWVFEKNIFWTTLITKRKGRKNFEFLHCPFEGQADMHQQVQPKRPTYDFKNPFSPGFVFIYRAKYIISRDVQCLYHFWARFHGVKTTSTSTKENSSYPENPSMQKRHSVIRPLLINFWKNQKLCQIGILKIPSTFRSILKPSQG